MRTNMLTGLMFLGCIFLTSALSAETEDIAAVREYWIANHKYPPPSKVFDGRQWTDGVMGWRFVGRISRWNFFDRLTDHRIYTFGRHPLEKRRVAVVAVDSSGLVTPLADIAAVVSMFRKEGIRVASASEAEALAKDNLLCRYPSPTTTDDSHKNWNALTLSLRVVSDVDDIPFATEEQKRRQVPLIRNNVLLRPPRLAVESDRYEYSLFYWVIYSGNLRRSEVRIYFDGSIEHESQVVMDEVGDVSDFVY